MTTETLHTNEVFALLDEPFSEMLGLLSLTNEPRLNTIPFKDSWTAAQVADHVTKSTSSIAKAMNIDATPTEKDPSERIEELKQMSLDFTVKFKSPAFILPTQNEYEKEAIIAKLNAAFDQLKDRANKVDLSEMISHPAFGNITKLELLYFVLYHTERHLHQLKNILSTIANK
ncbi:hypothetical protein BH10BAC3_BH10BAC3_38330 [soil metagenome]